MLPGCKRVSATSSKKQRSQANTRLGTSRAGAFRGARLTHESHLRSGFELPLSHRSRGTRSFCRVTARAGDGDHHKSEKSGVAHAHASTPRTTPRELGCGVSSVACNARSKDCGLNFGIRRLGKPATASHAHQSSVTTSPWRVQVTVVAVCMLLCNLDRVAMGILAMPLLDEFHIGLKAMGILQSSFLWGYFLAQIPSGLLSDKYGGGKTILAGLILWSLATCATSLSKFSPNPLAWAIGTRVVMGVGSAVALPATASIVAKSVPLEMRARCTTACYALFNVGNVLSNLLTPYLSESLGWEAAFALYGVAGMVFAWSCWGLFFGKGADEGADESERGGTTWNTQEGGAVLNEKGGEGKPLFSMSLQIAVLMYAHSTIGIGYFTLQSWIPMFLTKDIGVVSLKMAGLWTAIIWLATAMNTAFVGVIADKITSTRDVPTWHVRRLAMSVSTFVPAVCFFALSYVRNTTAAVVFMLIGLVSWSFDYAGFHPYVIDVAGHKAGTVLSITNSAGILSGIAGNIVTGYIAAETGSFSLVFRILSVVYLLSFVLWNAFMRGEKLQLSRAKAA